MRMKWPRLFAKKPEPITPTLPDVPAGSQIPLSQLHAASAERGTHRHRRRSSRSECAPAHRCPTLACGDGGGSSHVRRWPLDARKRGRLL